MADPNYLRDFYRSLADRPLEPDEVWYIDLYPDSANDPVEQLATCIEWSVLESTQLFSGFRGSGKSTELRRLRSRLKRSGRHLVVLCDMVDYVNVSSTIDISDFLISVAGAFGDALRDDPDLLGDDPGWESYWTRAAHFLRETRVDLAGLDANASTSVVAAGIRANLRQDLTFRQRLREAMRGRLGALVEDVRGFFKDCVRLLREKHGEDVQVVLLLDSIEQIRGTSLSSAEDVYASVEALFATHADSLHFEELHVVYTVPPWLKIRSAGIGGEYSGSQMLPCVTVCDSEGKPVEQGLLALERVVSRRGDWERLLGSRANLRRVLLASGGYLRDLFRLLQSVLRSGRNGDLPVDEHTLDLAMHEVRNGYLPIARADAIWLARVGHSHTPELAVLQVQQDEAANLYNLSRFFDTHMVLCYRDGAEWYDIHPLIQAEVQRQAAEPS
jgi:hypothetical protein